MSSARPLRIALNYLSNELPGFYGLIDRFQHRAPLGLMYLEAALQAAGYEAELIDQRLLRFDRDGWVTRMAAGRWDVIGLHSFANTRRHHGEYLAALRPRTSATLVVGGPDARRGAEYYLGRGADWVVIGEGERTLPALLERLARGESPLGMPGVVGRDEGGHIVRGPEAPALTIEELERTPRPIWNPARTRAYVDALTITYRRPIASMMTARGCPFRCAFCGSPEHFPTVRQRSVGDVIDEIDGLVRAHGVRFLLFHDDIFGIHADWALEFAEALSARRYDLRFMAILHPMAYGRRRVAVYEALARAGLSFVSYGAQSIDADVLRSIQRSPVETDRLRENVTLCRELGIATVLTYIFGLPGDTPEVVDRTIDYVHEVRPTLADFHPLFYIEGTPLAERYPQHDANPYSYETHKAWCRKARRAFYLNPATIGGLGAYLLRHNPRYFLTLARIALFALPHYVFERTRPVRWESGDARTDTDADRRIDRQLGMRMTGEVAKLSD